MENLPIKNVDVLTYTGLIAVLPFIVEGFKMLSRSFFTGKENWLSVILVFLIGVPVKISIPTAYSSSTGVIGWVTTLICLFLSAIAAMTVHDKVLAGMFGWQNKPTDPPAPPSSGSAPQGGSGSQSGRARLSLLLAVVFALALCAGAVSCTNTGTKTLAVGVEAETKQVFKEYSDYVIDGKPIPKFNDSDKDLRREQLRRIQALLDEGKH